MPTGCSPLPQALSARGVFLRRERPADRTFLRALYGEQRATELQATPWPEEVRQRFLDDQFRLQCAHFAAHPTAERRIVTRDRRPIGRLYLDRAGPAWGLLEVGLVATERGQGIGGALIGWVMRSAVEAGAVGVDLHVTRDNFAAAALYRRLGFGFAGPGSATHVRMEWRR